VEESAIDLLILIVFLQAGPGIVFAVQDGKNDLIVDSLLSGGPAEAQVSGQVKLYFFSPLFLLYT
jgi:hypothetical protein